jgi:hypothetical protein
MSSGASGNSSQFSGGTVAQRTGGDPWVNQDGAGNYSGNTYNGTDSKTLENSYESIFGPAGRDIKTDPQRHKRHQRWHLPDNLKGRNEYLTDRIDGLITDATNSPFTRNILPYVYMESPDQKIKWNVYSFDEGMASRVPYESAARVLTQSKTSHAGYAVRQGLAIVMEHNFLASAAGMANFQNQLKQLVGSIQLTNDLDVHIALLQAQSYQKTVNEKYYSEDDSLYSAAKRYVDMFGIMQKMPNALDILIEDAKNHLKTWGSQPPTFLMCPSDLTAQLQMSPERTNYITNGPDGLRRLAEGPNLPSYRGLSIIHSQKFSLEPGRKPRNVLRRKVRVAEYYWAELADVSSYQIYNQKKDMMTTFDKTHALKASQLRELFEVKYVSRFEAPEVERVTDWWAGFPEVNSREDKWRILEPHLRDGYCLLIRPNIEHEMLTVIAGRGGTQELGATFWGQTELACYDDAQHGIWGMSYKYHERAIVTNERNLIRMFDVAFDGYAGGMDTDILKLPHLDQFTKDTHINEPRYNGASVIALHFPRHLPVRPIANELVRMMIRMFVPQLAQSADFSDFSGLRSLSSSGIVLCGKMLDHIYEALVGDNISMLNQQQQELVANTAEFDGLDARGDTAQTQVARGARRDVLRPEIAELEGLIAGWPVIVVDIIGKAIEFYEKIRPGEVVDSLYRNILQVAYKQFRTTATPMTEATTTKVLHLLLRSSTSMKSDEFRGAFRLMLTCMTYNWATTEEMLEPLVANAELDKMLLYVMCLIHGIDVTSDMAAVASANWAFAQNNVVIGRPAVLLAIQQEEFEANNKRRGVNICLQLSTSIDYFDDIRYNVHCMEKAAFEVPNPVILSTFLREDPQAVGVDEDGSVRTDKDDQHNFMVQLKRHFKDDAFEPQSIFMLDLLDDFFAMYADKAVHLWSTSNIMPAALYIQNGTTELPSLAYHGNMVVENDRRKTREEIRCVGHLGNSFPGCACIRQGKGMLNMYEKQTTAVHVM